MRLLVDGSSASGVGGAWTRLRELARELPARAPQHEVAFVVRPRLRAQMEEIVAPGTEVITPPASLDAPPARVGWQLTRLPYRARRFAPDVVFSPFNILAPRWPVPRPRLAVMVSSLGPFSEDVRRTLRIHARPREVLLNRLTRSAMERADLVVFQSRFGLETACNGHTPARHVLIPHGPPPVEPAAGNGRPALPEPYVAVVGNRYPYKGLETVLEAISRIDPPERPRFALVGARADRRYSARLDRMVARLGLGQHVIDLGPLPHETTLAVVADAATCIACSGFENLSRIPGEAMALGTPLIATDIPGHRETAGAAAQYYRDGDPDALSRTIRRLIGDARARASAIAAGRLRTEEYRRADPVGTLLAELEQLAAAG